MATYTNSKFTFCSESEGTSTCSDTASKMIRNNTVGTSSWLVLTNGFTAPAGYNTTKVTVAVNGCNTRYNNGSVPTFGISATKDTTPSGKTLPVTWSGTDTTNSTASGKNEYSASFSVNLVGGTTYYLYICVNTSSGWSSSAWQAFNNGSKVTLTFDTQTAYTLTVKYNANGGTQASGNSYTLPYTTTATYGTNYNGSSGLWNISTFGLSKTGYTASTSWNTNSSGTGYSINQDTAYTAQALASACGQDLSKGNVTLNFYPIWAVNKVRIAYNINGGSLDGTKTDYSLNSSNFVISASGSNWDFHQITYGNSDDPYNASTFGLGRTGYDFDGWYLRTEDGNTAGGVLAQDTSYASTTYTQYNDKSKSTANTSTVNCYLYAKWNAKQYTVTYNANGGSGTMAASTATYNSAFKTTANTFTRTGYTFVGWNEKADGSGTAWGISSSSSGTAESGNSWTWTYTKNITLYAQWSINSYQYTLGSDTGVDTTGSTASGEKNYGTTITLKASTSAGYTWSKWSSNNTNLVADKTTADTTFTMPAGAITMTPVANPNTYYIAYNGNGHTGGSMSNSTCTYDVAKTLTKNSYVRLGYEFIGWNTKADGTGTSYSNEQSVSKLTITAEGIVTLYAQWNPLSQIFIWHEGDWHRALKYTYTAS